MGIAVSPGFAFRKIALIISVGNAGGLSDYVVVKEKHAIRLPDSIPLDVAGTNPTFLPGYLRTQLTVLSPN